MTSSWLVYCANPGQNGLVLNQITNQNDETEDYDIGQVRVHFNVKLFSSD